MFVGFPQHSTAEIFNGTGSEIVTSQLSYSVLCALPAYFIAYRLYLSTTIMIIMIKWHAKVGQIQKTNEDDKGISVISFPCTDYFYDQ